MTDAPPNAAAGRRRVVVIGGGVTGLTAGWQLLRAAAAGPDFTAPAFEVVVLEADRRAGGKLRTERRDGFLIDAGPDSFLTGKPAAVELCADLGLAAALIPQLQPRGASVLRRGRLVPIPPGLHLVHPTRPWALLRSPLLSPAGRLRAVAHPFVPRRAGARKRAGDANAGDANAGDESVGAFVQRRYGREMLRVLGEPLLAGIHLADPWQLSLAATFPGLRTRPRRPPPGRPQARGGAAPAGPRLPAGAEHLRGSPFASLRGGMAQLADALAARLGRALRTGAAVTAITPAPAGYRVRFDAPAGPDALDAAAVVVTTPAAVAARLVGGLNPPLAHRLGAAAAASSAVVTMGYAGVGGGFPAAGSGFLVPRGEGCRLLACTWSSAKWPERAPAGGLLLRAFIGGWRHPDLPARPDDQLLALVREELAGIPGFAFIRAGAPAVSRVHRWPDSTPLYRVGHRDWLAGVRAACSATPGLWLAGAPYDGVGIPDCIRQARAAADAAAAFLRR